MKIIDQVCTLEQGKCLKELGIDAPALFHWMPGKDGPHDQPYPRFGYHGDSLAPAYTVAELGEMIRPGEVTPLRCSEQAWVKVTHDSTVPYRSEAIARAYQVIFNLTKALNSKQKLKH